jgi:hypothetical protein
MKSDISDTGVVIDDSVKETVFNHCRHEKEELRRNF